MTTLNDLLPKGPVILDGAMATELEKLGVDTSTELWSARALQTDPGAIRAVHTSYFTAGARVATTNSYQANIPAFVKAGFDAEHAAELITLSAMLAREAADGWLSAHQDEQVLVAGSIGPYGAYLSDGSEYTGDYELSTDEYKDFHRPRIAALAEHVDIFAIETQPRLNEVQAIVQLMADEFPDAQAWESFQLRDSSALADGTQLGDAGAWADKQDNVVAIGTNCVPPQTIKPALRVLAGTTSKPLVTYPNSGDTYDAESKSWIEANESTRFTTYVPSWLESGAYLVGGCCRTNPSDIATLAGVVARHSR